MASSSIPAAHDVGLGAALRRRWPAHRRGITLALMACLTLGLAPYFPHAHVYKQLVNLWHGRLHEPIDVFDLVLHGAPWLWLVAALAAWLRAAARSRHAPV